MPVAIVFPRFWTVNGKSSWKIEPYWTVTRKAGRALRQAAILRRPSRANRGLCRPSAQRGAGLRLPIRAVRQFLSVQSVGDGGSALRVDWKWVGRVSLTIASLCVSLAALEAFARIANLDPLLPPSQELRQFRASGRAAHDAWVEDTRMGFRPRLGFRSGEGRQVYSRFGSHPNSYPLAKRSGVRRLLFLGDSVTARGRIVSAIRKAAGDLRDLLEQGPRAPGTVLLQHLRRLGYEGGVGI